MPSKTGGGPAGLEEAMGVSFFSLQPVTEIEARIINTIIRTLDV
jgi:hypothetical protein